ncbi:MAG: sigma-70 family RNA polymerase sigma factor [Verrucomicrobiota bacterium]
MNISSIDWIENLYRETAPQLLGYLVRRLGDTAGAEDALQETFAVVLRHPDRLHAASSPRAYLFGIARNKASRAGRSRRENAPLPADLPDQPAAVDPRLESMREAIGRLKPGFREALELRLQHELSYEEIAEALDVPVGTIRSRLHHAVLQLRQALNPSRPQSMERESA